MADGLLRPEAPQGAARRYESPRAQAPRGTGMEHVDVSRSTVCARSRRIDAPSNVIDRSGGRSHGRPDRSRCGVDGRRAPDSEAHLVRTSIVTDTVVAGVEATEDGDPQAAEVVVQHVSQGPAAVLVTVEPTEETESDTRYFVE